MKNNIFKTKKFKYGSYAVVFTIIVVVAVIALNLIITSLDNRYNLKIDLTETKMYSISDQTDEALKLGLGDSYGDMDITIYFLTDRDMIDYISQTNSSYSDSQYYTRVRDIAEEYARHYPDNIKVEYIDILRNPEWAYKKFEVSQSSTKFTSYNIIVEGSHHFRVLTFDAFYVTNESSQLYAFQGERRLTASILQCSLKEQPVIAFTTGHNEKYSNELRDIFSAASFDVREIDLVKEDVAADIEILVVSNPTQDFTFDEIDKLNKFMSDKVKYNSLIVMVNADTPKLDNFQEYLWDYWGLNYTVNYQLTDTSNSIGNNYKAVIGQYLGETNSAAYNFNKTARAKSGAKNAFSNAVVLELDIMGSAAKGVTVESVISTFNTATASSGSESNKLDDKTGEFSMLAISTMLKYGDNNADKYKFVMLVGSTDFASQPYISNSYVNRDIIQSAVRNMSTDRIIPDIDYKQFEDTGLPLTSEQIKTLSFLVIAVLPVIVIIAGIIVFFRRRHL